MKWFIQSYQDAGVTWYDVYLENVGAPLNAIEGILNTGNLPVDSVWYGDSMLRYWVNVPKLEYGKISFSGVRPFGFSGENFFVMRLKSLAKPVSHTFVMENFQVLAHDGQATPLWEGTKSSVSYQILDKMPAPIIPDTQPPFPMNPAVKKAENGQKFIPFHTQDDKTGVAKYEFHYADGRVEAFEDAGVLWLKGGAKAQFLWVYDLAGNVRKEDILHLQERLVLPKNTKTFYDIPLFWLGGLFLLALVAFVARRFFTPKA